MPRPARLPANPPIPTARAGDRLERRSPTVDARAPSAPLHHEGWLSLPNLKKISPKTLTALIEKQDVRIPLTETLELIPEPDGSATEDFVIPQWLEERQKEQQVQRRSSGLHLIRDDRRIGARWRNGTRAGRGLGVRPAAARRSRG